MTTCDITCWEHLEAAISFSGLAQLPLILGKEVLSFRVLHRCCMHTQACVNSHFALQMHMSAFPFLKINREAVLGADIQDGGRRFLEWSKLFNENEHYCVFQIPWQLLVNIWKFSELQSVLADRQRKMQRLRLQKLIVIIWCYICPLVGF